jgi:magnesium transporter
MSKSIKRRSQKVGLPPGTLMYIGDKKVETPRITIIHYDETHFEEKEVSQLEECFSFKDKPAVTWIDVNGLDLETIKQLGDHFGMSPLILEDILNPNQRPKLEDFNSSVYIVLRMLYCDPNHRKKVFSEQISLILGPNYVLSFQERIGDVFDPVRNRLRNPKGQLRHSGPDCLAYALIDIIVDNYFVVLEHLEEKIEIIEDKLLATNPAPETVQEIHHLKREMIFLRKWVWPLREVIAGLSRNDVELIMPDTRLLLADVYDHTVQVIETIETLREMLAGMLEIYLSSVSNRMNDVMRLLTVIATIFIPLSFIADVYNLNFFRPDLHWPWGYLAVLLVMAAVGGGMVIYFKRKKWL